MAPGDGHEGGRPDWLDPDWFRFGASTLLNDLAAAHQDDDRPLQRPRPLHGWTDDSMG